MIIIGVDYHPGFQQIAFVDTDTGSCRNGDWSTARKRKSSIAISAAQGLKVRVGMEASGHARWFERLLAELQFELWIGDAAEIRTKRVRKQKTDRQDAQLILRLADRKIVFRRSGYRAGRIAICGNCCGIGTGWCRRARGS